MTRHFLVSVLLFTTVAAAQEPERTVFQDVQVVDMETGSVLRDQTVVVSGDRIAAIGPSDAVEIPQAAIVIEAEGRYLLPGLAEMHGHVPGIGDRQYLEDVLFLYVANGVTTVRGMLGQPAHLELREQIANHEVLGPRLYTSGPSLRGGSVGGPENARRIVLEQAEAGYDFVKVHPGLTRAEFDAAVDAGLETGIDLAGHVSIHYGVGRALEARQATIDHLDGYVRYLIPPESDYSTAQVGFSEVNLVEFVDEDRITQVARETRDAGVWNVPTQSLVEHRVVPEAPAEIARRPEMIYMPPEIIQDWVERNERARGTLSSQNVGMRLLEIRQQLIKALHDEGAGLLLGSDAPQVFNVPGFSIHHELRGIVAAGLTPHEALRTGTIAPAEFFSAEDEFGRISVGLAADLVLVGSDPLEDVAAVSRPFGVMVRGQWLDRSRLDQGLAAIADRYR